MSTKKAPKFTPAGQAMTELVLAIFRANGRILAVGDGFGEDLGLTSSRWQVLGSIADQPRTVAQIARNFELTRQGVLWVVQALLKQDYVELIENPDHRTAKLVRLTAAGQKAYAEIITRHIRWVNGFAKSFALEDIESTERTLRRLWEQLGR